MIFDTMSKTNVGPIYVTTNNGWAGILASGNSVGFSFTGGRYEGYGGVRGGERRGEERGGEGRGESKG